MIGVLQPGTSAGKVSYADFTRNDVVQSHTNKYNKVTASSHRQLMQRVQRAAVRLVRAGFVAGAAGAAGAASASIALAALRAACSARVPCKGNVNNKCSVILRACVRACVRACEIKIQQRSIDKPKMKA